MSEQLLAPSLREDFIDFPWERFYTMSLTTLDNKEIPVYATKLDGAVKKLEEMPYKFAGLTKAYSLAKALVKQGDCKAVTFYEWVHEDDLTETLIKSRTVEVDKIIKKV